MSLSRKDFKQSKIKQKTGVVGVLYTIFNLIKRKKSNQLRLDFRASLGARTLDPLIKSQLLYQLS